MAQSMPALWLERADDDRPALDFEDQRWSWREVVAECFEAWEEQAGLFAVAGADHWGVAEPEDPHGITCTVHVHDRNAPAPFGSTNTP